MGEVYRADDPQLRRTVAIKRLSHSSDRELLNEAQRASFSTILALLPSTTSSPKATSCFSSWSTSTA
jgi:hypothetical protein